MKESDMLTVYAGAVKALPGGKIVGPVVIFGSPKETDLVGDYFTKSTDFGIHETLPVYFQHGFDPVMGKKRLATATLTPDPKASSDEMYALWAEYQLDLSDKYQAFLHQRAKEGKMGHSSGAVGHLVERKSLPNGSSEVTSWPLGELSLTPEPAEPKMMGRVQPVKAYETTKTFFTEAPEVVRVPVEIDVNVNVKQSQEGETMADEPKSEGTVVTPSQDLTALLEGMKNLTTSIAGIDAKIENAVKEQLKAHEQVIPVTTGYTQAPAVIKKRHVNFEDAYKAWALGDDGALKEMAVEREQLAGDATKHFTAYGDAIHITASQSSFKASNATTMTTTDTQGGAAVPQGHINEIIAKRDEMGLAGPLGVRVIPGSGAVTHVPIDNEDNGEWAAQTESATTDMDSPATDTKVFTLASYSKRVPITRQLLVGETSGLLAWVEDFVGRGLAKTENSLLVGEVGTSGTVFISFASSIAIAFGEPEDIMGDNDLSPYLDNTSSTAWVTRSATYWGQIAQITSANNRMYASSPGELSTLGGPGILGHPVHFSQKVTAIGAQGNPNAKALYFGNWNFVGVYRSPEFFVLRDPYSEANKARVNLHYWMQTVFKCLQEEAIGYGVGLDV